MSQTDQQCPVELDFDFYADEFVQRPGPVWAELLQRSGLWSTAHGGFHILSKYEDVAEGLIATDVLSSAQGIQIPAPALPRFMPIDTDPPDHREYRKILNPHMSPAVVAQSASSMRELAAQLIDAMPQSGEVDLASQFASPFAKTIALRLVGYPEADLEQIDHWVEYLVGEGQHAEDAAEQAGAFMGYVTEYITSRRAEPPVDDLTGAVLAGTFGGEPLDDATTFGMILLLTFGGLHTISSAVAAMLLWLADHPEDRQRLRDEPELIPTAVDEFIRYASPVGQQGRTAVADAEFGGCPIRAGDKVLLMMGAANHDPANFDRPHEVVLDRTPNKHLAFGLGPHRCVGSHYAKLMVRVALEETLARFRDFTITDHARIRYSGGQARGLLVLPAHVEKA